MRAPLGLESCTMSSGPKILSAESAAFLGSGVSMLVGTRNAANRPTALRASGVRVHEDRAGFDVFLGRGASARVAQDLAEVPRIAVTASRPCDYRTFQIKGAVRRVREGREDERVVTEEYLARFAALIEEIGMPRIVTTHIRAWPALVVEVEIEAIFDQTPGPNAGVPLRGGFG